MPINKEFNIQHLIEKNQLAVTVASKETSHQSPLILPTSVGSTEMKNYIGKENLQTVSPAFTKY